MNEYSLMHDELEGIPAPFIVHTLRQLGSELWESIRLSKRLLDGDSTIELSSIILPPSHVFALSIQENLPNDSSMILWPIHDIIIASHCSRVSSLPSSSIITSNSPTFNAVPLSVPYPSSLRLILRYLYTQDTASLFHSLLAPCIKHSPKHSRRHLSRVIPRISIVKFPNLKLPTILAKHCPTSILSSRLQLVRRLWENAMALGIEDAQLWEVLNMVSNILVHALQIRRYIGYGI
ncbi:hypothetical protein FRB91_006036 [Serendipita sp. 411]|nr:hypothetical protein FRB91_006036 [Serendipita sp. 411]